MLEAAGQAVKESDKTLDVEDEDVLEEVAIEPTLIDSSAEELPEGDEPLLLGEAPTARFAIGEAPAVAPPSETPSVAPEAGAMIGVAGGRPPDDADPSAPPPKAESSRPELPAELEEPAMRLVRYLDREGISVKAQRDSQVAVDPSLPAPDEPVRDAAPILVRREGPAPAPQPTDVAPNPEVASTEELPATEDAEPREVEVVETSFEGASPSSAGHEQPGGFERPAAAVLAAKDAPTPTDEIASAPASFSAAVEANAIEAPPPREEVARAHRLFEEAREIARRQSFSSQRRFTIDLPVDRGAPVRLTITPDHQGHHRVALVAATHIARAELEKHRDELEEIVQTFPLDVTTLSIDAATPTARQEARVMSERSSIDGNLRNRRG